MIPGLTSKSYEERLLILNLVTLETTRMHIYGDRIEAFRNLNGLDKVNPDLFLTGISDY